MPCPGPSSRYWACLTETWREKDQPGPEEVPAEPEQIGGEGAGRWLRPQTRLRHGSDLWGECPRPASLLFSQPEGGLREPHRRFWESS